MKHLLNLLAAVALLVWGTQIVRTGILRVFGAKLRVVLARSMRNRLVAAAAGVGVTALVQSGTATALIVSSFVGQGLVALPAALAVMLGADVGSAVMATVFSLDLSWLSPLLILFGVVLTLTRQESDAGHAGRVLIGLGLMLLALRLVGETAAVLTSAPAIRELLGALSSDRMLEITLGALLVLMAWSSLAIVLLIATLAASGVIPLEVALGLVLGANLGSGLLAALSTARTSAAVRQLPLGNLLFKMLGVAIIAPFADQWARLAPELLPTIASVVVLFHLAFNAGLALLFIGLTGPAARLVARVLPTVDAAEQSANVRLNHLDASALSTPSLAIACAAREAMHQADVVETMLRGLLPVLKRNDLRLSKKLRQLDDAVDDLYSSIKGYLTRLSRESLAEEESRRWTDIISFTINMEHIGDTIERVLLDIEEKKIRKNRNFSAAGMAEIIELHAQLLQNLRLGMSVFLNRNLHDARRLLEQKAQFRELELNYANKHLARLSENTWQSVETSSLHLEVIGEFKRINSHICSIAYPILESAGALNPNRLRPTLPAAME